MSRRSASHSDADCVGSPARGDRRGLHDEVGADQHGSCVRVVVIEHVAERCDEPEHVGVRGRFAYEVQPIEFGNRDHSEAGFLICE